MIPVIQRPQPPQLEVSMYFISYVYDAGRGKSWGNIDIIYDRPIVSRDDINAITDIIANELDVDASDIVILNWRRYDSPNS